MTEPATVLIVDDDAAFADFVRIAVETVGHRAVIATDGEQARAAFEEETPGLVLLDILLPRKDGFHVCADLKKLPGAENVPIVMTTGIYKKASFRRDGLAAGAIDYVHKPIGVRDLWSLLARHLGERDAPLPCEPSGSDAPRLSEVPLAAILAEHLKDESCGVLFVRGSATSYAIYLQDGAPVFIRSNGASHRLDQVLVQSGQVDEEQLRAAMSRVTESRGRVRLGQALVQTGALTDEQFRVALQLQLRLLFRRAFQLSHGHCVFVWGDHPTEEDVLVETEPAAMILSGARDAGSDAAVERILPSRRAPLRATESSDERARRLGLKPHERSLLDLADGTLTTERLVAVAESAGHDGRRLVLGLLLAGLLEAGEPEEDATPEPTQQDWSWRAERWRDLPVGAAVAELHRRAATGTLEVRATDDGPAKRVAFRAGNVVAVESDVEEDALADMVLRLELVEEGRLDGILDELGDAASDRALAKRLVQSCEVSPLQVYWAAVYRAQAVVVGLLALRGARLAWFPERLPCSGLLPDVPTAEIVQEAVRALNGAALRVLMPSKSTRFVAEPGAARGAGLVPLGELERRLLERLSEPASLETLLRERAGSGDDVRRALHALTCCRLVRVAEAAEQQRPRAAEAASVARPAEAREPDGFADAGEPDFGAAADPPGAVATSAREGAAGAETPEEVATSAVASEAGAGTSFLDMLHEDAFEGLEEDVEADEPVARAGGAPAPEAGGRLEPSEGLVLPIDTVLEEELVEESAPDEDRAEVVDVGDPLGGDAGESHGDDPDPRSAAEDPDRRAVPDGPTHLTERVERLGEEASALLPVVAALRRALSGDARRVEVDRARLAELLGSFEDVAVAIRALSAESKAEIGSSEEEATERQREPVGAGTGALS